MPHTPDPPIHKPVPAHLSRYMGLLETQAHTLAIPWRHRCQTRGVIATRPVMVLATPATACMKMPGLLSLPFTLVRTTTHWELPPQNVMFHKVLPPTHTEAITPLLEPVKPALQQYGSANEPIFALLFKDVHNSPKRSLQVDSKNRYMTASLLLLF